MKTRTPPRWAVAARRRLFGVGVGVGVGVVGWVSDGPSVARGGGVGFGVTEAWAHALDIATARVTLRDGQIEVAAELDLLSLVPSGPSRAALAAGLAVAPDAALASALGEARAALEAGAAVEVDGERLPVVVSVFPAVDAVREIARRDANHAQTVAGVGEGARGGHPPMGQVRLEVVGVRGDARRVTVRLPPQVGPVMYSFVQPTVALAKPGVDASFAVLAARAPARGDTRAWLVAGGVVCAAAAVAAQLLPLLRRRGRGGAGEVSS